MAFGVRGFPLGNPFSAARGGIAPGALGAGPPNMDPGVLNQLLGQYGVGLPQQLIPPGPFEQMGGFAGHHPGLATGLDNALIAASLMGPTGATAGENISNAARGILGVEPYRRQFAAEQYMLPLQVAQSIGGLQAQQAMMKMYQGMGQYYADTGKSRLESPEMRMQQGIMKEQFEAAKNQRLGKNGMVQQQEWDPVTMQPVWKDQPDIDPKAFMQTQLRTKTSQRFGGGAMGDMIANDLANAYKGYENIPEVIDPKIYHNAYANAQRLSAGYQGIFPRAQNQANQDAATAAAKLTQNLIGTFAPLPSQQAFDKQRRAPIMAAILNGNQRISYDQAVKMADQQIQQEYGAMQQRRGKLESDLGELQNRWLLSPERSIGMPFETYLDSQGFNRQTGVFNVSQPGAPQGSAPIQPGATVVHPPALPGQPAQSPSAAMQQLMQLFKKQ